MRAFDGGVDLVACDIDHAVVLRARGSAFLIFILAMKSGPKSTVSFTITQQRHFFGNSPRHSQRLNHEDQLVEAFPVDESGEVALTSGIVQIQQVSQLAVVAQSFSNQFLVIAKLPACLACGWT